MTGSRFSQWRIVLLGIIFAAWASYLLYRVYSYQVVEYARFRMLAVKEHAYQKELIPRRGDILDRNGNPLAVSTMYQSLYAYPPQIKDPDAVAGELAPILSEPKDAILATLKSTKSFVLIKQKLSSEVSTRIAGLAIPGTLVLQEPFRGYPEGNIAPQLLGFVGKDFQGLAGLESSLDRDLAGEKGLLDAEKDTVGGEIAIGRRGLIPPVDGSDVFLTIDRYIQRVAERELAAGIKENKASGGVIIVMDPKTGAILAAATEPTYDLTAPEVYDPAKAALYKPTIATNLYEPGSVMKLMTMAAALDQRIVNPSTTFVDTGAATFDGARITNWDLSAHGVETMTEILVNSCNIGAIHVSGLLGPERFYRYLDAFGFGKVTGIELPGEEPGTLRTPSDPHWSRLVMATNSFGQGISATPIQMVTAAAAIANDGVLPRPMIVRAFRDGSSVREVPPAQTRRVLSSETARTLTDMMVHVVEDNSLRLAVVPGYKIAGKTGTADLPTTSGYNTNWTYASQIGFGPVGDPKFIILVRLDGAEKKYGGQVASPVFRRVAEQILSYMRIPPTEPVKRVPPTPARPPVSGEPGPAEKPTSTPERATPVPARPAPTSGGSTSTPVKPTVGASSTVSRTPTATPTPARTATARPGATATPTQPRPSPTRAR